MEPPTHDSGSNPSPAPTSNASYEPPPPPTSHFSPAPPQPRSEPLASPMHPNMGHPQPNGMPPVFAYPTMPGPHGMPHDHFLNNEAGLATPGISPTHPSAGSLSAQKRAYRQRRKDPSCDACRERKVKCDATDTSSCSECSSRGVKCQFTKETNRRMSSIKQVQDLEKQLNHARQEINRLRAANQEGGADLESNNMNVPALHLPDSGPKQKQPPPPAMERFDDVRNNIRNYGRGIFKPPPPYRLLGPQPTYPHVTHALPPKHVADRLLSHYHGSVHVYAPHLHWPTFIQEYENVYRIGSFQQSPHIWVSLFYGVLACGTLMDPQPNGSPQEGDGAQYLDMCIRSINTWSDELTMDSTRAALLISIYFIEINLRSAGWMWLGAAVRTAQDIGLHTERGPYPPMEAEMRRRVWWSVYNWDRIVSLETGKPLMIDDDDCDVGEPTPVDDDCIRPEGIITPSNGQMNPSGLISVIPVVRIYGKIKKTLRSRTIAAQTIATWDEHFAAIMRTYPDPYHIQSQSYLDPRLLTAACALQTARFFLFRHNLSPACRKQDRIEALDRCAAAARETAHYVQRSMQQASPPPSSGYYSPVHMANWGARLRTMAPAFFCSHLWRCALVLCLRLEFGPALTVVQASTSIGDLRRNNIACGRNLAFFLEALTSRLRSGATKQSLELDEEMLAYASGDLQGCYEESWVWTGSDTNPAHSNGHAPNMSTPDQQPQTTNTLTERETHEWGGWEQIQRTLNQLLHEQQGPPPTPNTHAHPYPQTPSYPPPSQTPGQYPPPPPAPSQTPTNQHLAPIGQQQQGPSSHSSLSPVGSNGGAAGGSSRISIQDIM